MYKYYPYLRAKTHELKAVNLTAKALAQNGRIMPILEPVRVATSSVLQCAAALQPAGLSVALVLNPRVGELQGSFGATTQLLAAMRGRGAVVVPAIIVDGQLQASDLQAFQSNVQGSQVFVHVDAAQQALLPMLQGYPNATHLLLEGATSSSYQSVFSNRALLRDCFAAQRRNASYPARSFFTDLHLNCAQLGFGAFGDFVTVGEEFRQGGGPAYAVAIHMTEDGGANGVHCNHFVSTSNATTANPAGKFGQAAGALATYVHANPGRIDFSLACQELLGIHSTGRFPGLGLVKQLSIRHHLELMARLV